MQMHVFSEVHVHCGFVVTINDNSEKRFTYRKKWFNCYFVAINGKTSLPLIVFKVPGNLLFFHL